MPRCFGASRSVRARRIIQSARCPSLVQIFLTVNDVVVAVTYSSGLEPRQVRPGARFAEPLAPEFCIARGYGG